MEAVCHRFKHTITLFAFVWRLLPFLTREDGNSKSLTRILCQTAVWVHKELDCFAELVCHSVEKLKGMLCLLLWCYSSSWLLIGAEHNTSIMMILPAVNSLLKWSVEQTVFLNMGISHFLLFYWLNNLSKRIQMFYYSLNEWVENHGWFSQHIIFQ